MVVSSTLGLRHELEKSRAALVARLSRKDPKDSWTRAVRKIFLELAGNRKGSERKKILSAIKFLEPRLERALSQAARLKRRARSRRSATCVDFLKCLGGCEDAMDIAACELYCITDRGPVENKRKVECFEEGEL